MLNEDKVVVTNVIAGGSPARVGGEKFWAIFNVFWQYKAAFQVREPCCDLETQYWSLKPI